MPRTVSQKATKDFPFSKLAPRANRELQARMKLAGVDARRVARQLKICYARCTEVIAGTRVHAANFAKIHAYVFSLPVH